MTKDYINYYSETNVRHPELVSGSRAGKNEILKQVQDDESVV